MEFYENVIFVTGMAEFVWPRNSSDPDTTMSALQEALDAPGQLFLRQHNEEKQNARKGGPPPNCKTDAIFRRSTGLH